MTGIARLTGTVKHYDWGGHDFIPALLQIKNQAGTPYAEYWLGIHPLSDCRAGWPGKTPVLLRDMINKDREAALGKPVYRAFGNLPYLVKTLDIRNMLSIQVHPSKARAEAGFARENAAGIPPDAPHRNYKDENHKPELALALSEFWLLHGFKPGDKMAAVLQQVEELRGLLPFFEDGGYARLYRQVMEMPQGEVNAMLGPLMDRILPLYHEGGLEKYQEDFWAARAALTYSQGHSIDRGIFSIYFFNLLCLQKGEAIFQDAGIPHAYLEGQIVEIMSNSDNVLRGGLTNKHIDVKELLLNVEYRAADIDIMEGERADGNEKVYRTPAPDFELSCFTLDTGEQGTFTARTAEILLLTEGHVRLGTNTDTLELMPGSPAAIVFPGLEIELQALSPSMVFRTSVPVHIRE